MIKNVILNWSCGVSFKIDSRTLRDCQCSGEESNCKNWFAFLVNYLVWVER